jgi:hypothetical protein
MDDCQEQLLSHLNKMDNTDHLFINQRNVDLNMEAIQKMTINSKM